MVARALLAFLAAACGWLAVLSLVAHNPSMAKFRPVLLTALAAAAGAVLPMLPALLADAPPYASAIVSALVTALALRAKSPAA